MSIRIGNRVYIQGVKPFDVRPGGINQLHFCGNTLTDLLRVRPGGLVCIGTVPLDVPNRLHGATVNVEGDAI